MSSRPATSEPLPPGSSEGRRSEPGSGLPAVTVNVSDVKAYEDESSERVARMAKAAPVLFESSVKLPKLGPDGERLEPAE